MNDKYPNFPQIKKPKLAVPASLWDLIVAWYEALKTDDLRTYQRIVIILPYQQEDLVARIYFFC